MIGRRGLAPGLLGAIVLVALFGGASAVGLLPSGSSHTPLPVGLPAAHPAPLPDARAAVALSPASGHSANPRPLVTLPCMNNPPWPSYAVVGDGLPPNAYIPDQLGCALYDSQDEVHASFLSSVAGSGARFTESIHLPPGKAQVESSSATYLGMVVSGDNLSAWNQSFLEVMFIPVLASGSITYTTTVSVYSLVNGTHGTPEVFSCPAGWFGLAWNNSGWCEGGDFGAVESSGVVVGGSWFNVTFAGKVKTGPVSIWANDSTNGAGSFSLTLNSSTTGSFNFTPGYNAACQTCLLEWGMGYGNGIGVGICPATSSYAQCNSYGIFGWYDHAPVEYGIPEFWNGASYSSDFQYLGFESASGACSYVGGGLSNPPVSICIAQDALNGTGYYPYFTYNGSMMDFGTTYNWTTWDFGGPSIQFNVAGTMTPKLPVSLDNIVDSSRGGYIEGGTPFNVTARLQAVGHIVNASLVYRFGALSWTHLAMSEVNGTSSFGYYNATIPGSGSDGTIQYWVSSTDLAGLSINSQIFSVIRGPLPTFSVQLTTNPPRCGGALINGTLVTNGQTVLLKPGTYPLGVRGCYPYINPNFTPSKNLFLRNGQTELEIRGNGTLLLGFTFNPPTLYVHVATAPSACGSLSIGGTSYGDGQIASIIWERNYSLSPSPCANTVFAGYTFSSSSEFNVTVGIGSATLQAATNGSLTVHYAATTTALPILFETRPIGCRGISFGGTVYLDGYNMAVDPGTYPIAPAPCAKWGFLKWTPTGGANVTGGNVSITAASTIVEVNYPLTIVTYSVIPAACGSIELDGVNYTSGQSLVIANNSTHLVYGFATCANYTVLALTSDGGLHLVGNLLTANGSGTIYLSLFYGTPTTFVGFITDPVGCGSIQFEGMSYLNTNYTFVAPGTVATLAATPCNTYGFLRWAALGPGILIDGNTAYINGPGAIEAQFTGLVNIFLYTEPAGCGSIVLDGTAYTGNSTPAFPAGINVSLSAQPCPGYTFSRWAYTPGAILWANTVEIASAAQLKAFFVPVTYAVTVVLSPARCGTVILNGQPTPNGTTWPLSLGSYSLIVRPCPGDYIVGYTVVGNLTVIGPTLFVNSSGSITILMQPVEPSLALYLPDSSEAGFAAPLGATVAVPIPPFNYTYQWTFGDGGSDTTVENFTDHTYGTPGLYRVSVVVTDPLGRNASANGTITIVAPLPTTTISNLVPAAVAAAASLLVVAAAYWYTTPGRSRPSSPSDSGPTERLHGGAASDAPGLPAPPTDEPVSKEP